MRRPRQRLQVTTFPFLAVLLCAMGSLILLLLVIDKRAKIVARMKAWQATVQQAENQEKPADQFRLAAAQHREEDLRRQLEQIRRWAEQERRRQTVGDLLRRQATALRDQAQQEMARAAQVAAESKAFDARRQQLENRLQAERAEVARAEAALANRQAQRGKNAEQAQAAQAELARLDATLREFERTLAELRALRQQEGQTFSLVPYHGKQGDGRKPLYLECTDAGVIVHPGRKFFGNLAVSGVDLRTEVARRSATNPRGRLYALFLVRPMGIETYYQAQSALEDLPLDFGYELIDTGWVLDFPDEDSATSALAGTASPSGTVGVGIGNGQGLSRAGNGRGVHEGGTGTHPPGFGTGPPGPGGTGDGTGLTGGPFSAGSNGPGGNGAGALAGRPGGNGIGPFAGPPGNGAGRFGPGGNGIPGSAANNTGSAGIKITNGTGTGSGNATGSPQGNGVAGTTGNGANSPGLAGIKITNGTGTGSGNGTDPAAALMAGGVHLPGSNGNGTGALAGNRGAEGSAGSPGQGSPDPGNRASLGPNLMPAVNGSRSGTGQTAGKPGSGSSGEKPEQPSAGNPGSGSSGGQEANGMQPSISFGGTSGGTSGPSGACAEGGGPSDPAVSPPRARPGEWAAGASSSSAPPDAEPRRPLPVRLNTRDWVLVVECQADGAMLIPGGQRFTLQELARRREGDNPLAQAVRQAIVRRKALRGPGESWDRPRIRLRVQPGGERAYYLAYPALEPLHLPLAQEEVAPDEENEKRTK